MRFVRSATDEIAIEELLFTEIKKFTNLLNQINICY